MPEIFPLFYLQNTQNEITYLGTLRTLRKGRNKINSGGLAVKATDNTSEILMSILTCWIPRLDSNQQLAGNV